MIPGTLTRSVLIGTVALLGACKDKNTGPVSPGPPANIAIVAGNLTAPANTVLSGIQLVVRDERNTALPNQTVSFSVVGGGGSIQQTTATTDADGTLAVPAWLLGKSAIPQKLRATIGSVTFDVDATVQTNYNIVVRFFGPAMTADQQALFTDAAARIRGVITGELANVTTGSVDLQPCLGTSLTINETIDDVVIYATISPIDSAGKVLASAGPCYIRSGKAGGRAGTDSLTSIIGVMRFDSADIPNIPTATLQSVIMHEMLHVVGVGSLWLSDSWNLVADTGTIAPRYTGPQARQGCLDIGGTITCATGVPVENDGGPGTANVHWEESAFDTELMTGYVEGGGVPMPFSLLTIRSLIDIGYTVNLADFDPFTKPFGAARANAFVAAAGPWEQVGTMPLYSLDLDGRRRPQLRRAAR